MSPADDVSVAPWLNRLPASWSWQPLKYAVRLVGDRAEHDPEHGDYIGLENIESWSGLLVGDTDTRPEGIVGYFDRGDILFGKLRPYLAKVMLATKQGTASTEAMILRPSENIDARFAWYFLTTPTFIDVVNGSTFGSKMPRANWEFVGSQPISVPPLPEQRTIAAYLDRETGRIDALVERLERLTALLTEKRQAVISRAVTKGLDPSAPMKDSGIDWLGEVPAHWEERRLYTFAKFVQGKAHEPFFDPNGDFVCATARFVSTGGEPNRYSTENLTPAAPNDILMVMSDLPNGRALARAYLTKSNDRIAINQRVAGITVVEGSPTFMAFQIDRHPELLAYNDGSNQTHLKNSYFTQLVLRFPPVAEQLEIATYLENTINEIDRLRLRAETVIEVAKERRAALISAAVTGQIPMSEMEAA